MVLKVSPQEVSDSDYPIYDYSDSDSSPVLPDPVLPVSKPAEKEPVLTQSQFIPPSEMDEIAKMPIFNNFPMMKPHEFINLITESEDGELPCKIDLMVTDFTKTLSRFFSFQREPIHKS